MIVDFLIHLREDKGFSLSALKGYRSTISSVFTLKGNGSSKLEGAVNALPQFR